MLSIKKGADCSTPLRTLFNLVVSCRIMATVDCDGCVEDDRFSSFASPQDQIVRIGGCLRNIPVIERRIVPGFQYLKPFGDQERRELPEFFEFAVGVDNERDVFFWMIRGDSEIGCHNVFLLMPISAFPVLSGWRTGATFYGRS